jgi:uncharacterized membrane protein YgcG
VLARFALRVVCGAIAFTALAWSQQGSLVRAGSAQADRAAEQASEGEPSARPPPTLDIVRDDAGVLSREEDRNLTAFLQEILDETGVKVFVVLVPTTAPDTSERYGGRFVEYWAKRGALNPANTVIAVLAIEDRHLSVLAGRGLPALQRELAGGGALSFVVPCLKDERYFDAMMALSRWLSRRLRSSGRST